MKTVKKMVLGAVTLLGSGLAISAVHAQQGPMGGGMGPGMMQGQMMQAESMGKHPHMKAMRELMAPEERLSMMDKMMDAKTPEERRSIMNADRAEMEKRAKEKGITLPSGHGSHRMSGRNCG